MKDLRIIYALLLVTIVLLAATLIYTGHVQGKLNQEVIECNNDLLTGSNTLDPYRLNTGGNTYPPYEGE